MSGWRGRHTRPSSRTRLVAVEEWELEYVDCGLAPDVLWMLAEWRAVYGDASPEAHEHALAHLRERAALP